FLFPNLRFLKLERHFGVRTSPKLQCLELSAVTYGHPEKIYSVSLLEPDNLRVLIFSFKDIFMWYNDNFDCNTLGGFLHKFRNLRYLCLGMIDSFCLRNIKNMLLNVL